MKKAESVFVAVLCIILVLFVIFAVLYLNSYTIALCSADFPRYTTRIVDMGINDNGQEYRVVADWASEDYDKLAYMVKGFAGFWKIVEISDEYDAETGLMSLEWSNLSGDKRYSVGDANFLEYKVQELYCGNNANKEIEIPLELLPEGVTVNINQGGSDYLIHFVKYGDSEAIDINCYELLKSLGYVA